MNKVILSGRLTRDLEIRYSQGENSTAIARGALAVDRRFKRNGDDQTADFINIVAFGKTAEFMEKYMGTKGQKIIVCGRIQTGSYTNKEGQKVYTTDVIVEECDFASDKNSNGGNTSASTPSKPALSRSEPSQATSMDGFMNIPDGLDEELPFN